MATSSSAVSMVKGVHKKQHQVFINFCGKELRNNFISHLVVAFKEADIKYYIDKDESRGEHQDILFTRIEESDMALAVFSKGYSESKWCLDELVKIMQNVEKKKLRVIPIFFHVSANDVEEQKGEFGKNYDSKHDNETRANKLAWKKALQSAAKIMGLVFKNDRDESELISNIVASVKDAITAIERGEGASPLISSDDASA